MNYLIDTHTFIWSIAHTGKLSKSANEIIINNENSIFVSVLSFWEIALKVSMKKFTLEGITLSEIPKSAQEMNFQILNLTANESCTFANLPKMDNHKDPFDRMIIWQAISNNLMVISNDGFFEQYQKYGLQLVW